MKMRSKTGRLLAASAMGFSVMSASLLIMPVQGLGVLPGILFWAGLLAGVLGQILLAVSLRKQIGRAKGFRWGLTTFGANRLAKLADFGLLASLLAAVVTLTISPAAYICYVALAATLFCFCMHCILNGRAFGYVLGHDRSRRKPDHNNQKEKGDGTR